MIRLESLASVAAARRRLALARAGLGDLRALHERVGRHLVDWSLRNLDAEGALHRDFPSGWPPLSPLTIASRGQNPGDIRMLQDTGRLRAGISLQADGRQARLFNPVPYAAYHELGRGVPRRSIFPPAAQAETLAAPLARRFVEERVP